jgi:hypothetical protein
MIGNTLRQVLMVAVGVAVFTCIYQYYIIPSLHLQLNPERAKGFQHYFMMGLNSLPGVRIVLLRITAVGKMARGE